MDTSNLKNIVVLKDLPSNIVEEAIVVLKENQKVAKLEPASKDNKEKNETTSSKIKNELQKSENSKDYIIKEAQMLIAEYISRVENKNKKENQSIKKLNKKCERLKYINKALLFLLAISIIFNLFIK